MDALTDVLESVHLSGSVYCRSELTAPWAMRISASKTAQFHVVRRGRCWLRLDERPGLEPERLEGGDVVLLPQGDAHTLIACYLPPAGPSGKPAPLCYGGGGEPLTLVCGYFTFDAGAVHPLLSVLPALVLVQGEAGRARSWLESTLDLIAYEATSGRPGGETLINRLTEALFIQVLRANSRRSPIRAGLLACAIRRLPAPWG
jgi:hypothetical protein